MYKLIFTKLILYLPLFLLSEGYSSAKLPIRTVCTFRTVHKNNGPHFPSNDKISRYLHCSLTPKSRFAVWPSRSIFSHWVSMFTCVKTTFNYAAKGLKKVHTSQFIILWQSILTFGKPDSSLERSSISAFNLSQLWGWKNTVLLSSSQHRQISVRNSCAISQPFKRENIKQHQQSTN